LLKGKQFIGYGRAMDKLLQLSTRTGLTRRPGFWWKAATVFPYTDARLETTRLQSTDDRRHVSGCGDQTDPDLSCRSQGEDGQKQEAEWTVKKLPRRRY